VTQVEIAAGEPPLAVNAARTLATTLLIQAVGLATGVLVARGLGVEGRGLLAAVILWPSVLTYLGDLGGPVGYAFLAANEPQSRPVLVRAAGLLTTAQTVFIVATGVPVVLLALHGRPRHAATIAAIFLVCYVPMNLYTRYINAVNQARERLSSFNAVRLSVPIAYLVFLVGLLVADRLTLRNTVVATAASNLVATVLAWRSARAWRGERSAEGVRAVSRRVLHYGLRSHIGNLTPIDSMQLDLLLVTLLLSPRQAGLYTVAASAAAVVRVQGTALGLVGLPAVARERSPQEARHIVASLVRTTMLVGMASAALIALCAPFLIRVIYGTPYVPATWVVRLLVFGIVLASVRQVAGDCLRGLGRPGAASVAEVASWVVGAPVALVAIPTLGSTGAALAVIASYGAALAVCVRFLLAQGLTLADLLIVRGADVRFVADVVREIVRPPRQVRRAPRGRSPRTGPR
jgi:O-antigen/teichoic acid export membrane protein